MIRSSAYIAHGWFSARSNRSRAETGGRTRGGESMALDVVIKVARLMVGVTLLMATVGVVINVIFWLLGRGQ